MPNRIILINRLKEIEKILRYLPRAEWKQGTQNLSSLKWQLYTEKRRIKIKLATHGNVTLKTTLEYFNKQEKKCQYCNSKKNLTIDHKIPINKGGKHSIDNFQILCSSCNSKKGDRYAK